MQAWIIRVAIGAAAALAALALASQPAHAAGPHVFSFAMSGAGTTPTVDPMGLTVDNSAGPNAHDVYVTDPTRHRVVRLEPSGDFDLMLGDGVNATTGGDVCTAASGHTCGAGRPPNPAGGPPGALGHPRFLAVDPTSGFLYVGDHDTSMVTRFSFTGHLDPTWGDDGRIRPAGSASPGIWGLAVGADGDLFVLDPNFVGDSYPQSSTIREFDDEGDESSNTFSAGAEPTGLAIDAAGNFYHQIGVDLNKTGPDGADLGALDLGGQLWGFGVDAAGDLYAHRHGGEVQRYSLACPWPHCTPLSSFGAGHRVLTSGSLDLAVDAATDTVYASSPAYWGGFGQVAVFVAPGIVPEVVTGEGTLVGPRTTTLAGSVDPAGNGAVTGCGFEYVKRVAYQYPTFRDPQVVQCTPPPPYHGPTEVSAAPPLEGGTLYHYRLVASNAQGKRTGLERNVQTGSRAEAVTGLPDGVGPTSATVTGSVDPDPLQSTTGCYFEYVRAADYQEGAFLGAESAQCSPVPPYSAAGGVRAVLPGLKPQTAYRYRLRVWDLGGTNTGGALSLATPAKDVVRYLDEEEEEGESLPRGKPPRWWKSVRCAKRACSVVLEAGDQPRHWRSPRFPSAFGWLFNLYRRGEALEHTKLVRGCVATFSAEEMLATLNACHGRFRLTYLGAGPFKVRWRVFERCRCAEHTRRPAPPLSRRGARPAFRTFR